MDKKSTTVVENINEEDNFTLEWWEIPSDIRHHLPSLVMPDKPEMFVDNGPVPDEMNPFSTKYQFKEVKVPPNRLFDAK